MKIDFNTLEEYYKTLQYLEYEYTNNLIYEFFKRTLDNSDNIDNYEYKPPISYTLTLKDVILFENSEIRFTLQDIIYNSCNEFYEECMNDQKIKDKLNFSINITDFLTWFKDKKDKDNDKELLKPVIYKDLNLNKFIKITEDEILKKIDETLTYKKINIRYSKKQLNIQENNFVTIHDLNLNLPENEILEYIKLLKQKHRTLKYNTNSKHQFNELSENEIDNIKTFILYMSKPENQNKSNASINFFKNLSSIKYNQQLKQQIDITEEYYNKYILSKNEPVEKIKYKSYIYDRNKLFYILFIYDCMKLKTKTDSYDLMMKKIQILILSYRRMELELFDYDDFKKYKIDEKNYNKFKRLIQILVNELKLNIIDRTDNLTTQDIKNSIRNINTENIENIKKSIENINKFLSKNNMKMFTEFPYLSIRTLYKYHSIAKFYIDEGNYKLLLEQ